MTSDLSRPKRGRPKNKKKRIRVAAGQYESKPPHTGRRQKKVRRLRMTAGPRSFAPPESQAGGSEERGARVAVMAFSIDELQTTFVSSKAKRE
jgi:hypothetical protein